MNASVTKYFYHFTIIFSWRARESWNFNEIDKLNIDNLNDGSGQNNVSNVFPLFSYSRHPIEIDIVLHLKRLNSCHPRILCIRFDLTLEVKMKKWKVNKDDDEINDGKISIWPNCHKLVMSVAHRVPVSREISQPQDQKHLDWLTVSLNASKAHSAPSAQVS